MLAQAHSLRGSLLLASTAWRGQGSVPRSPSGAVVSATNGAQLHLLGGLPWAAGSCLSWNYHGARGRWNSKGDSSFRGAEGRWGGGRWAPHPSPITGSGGQGQVQGSSNRQPARSSRGRRLPPFVP